MKLDLFGNPKKEVIGIENNIEIYLNRIKCGSTVYAQDAQDPLANLYKSRS